MKGGGCRDEEGEGSKRKIVHQYTFLAVVFGLCHTTWTVLLIFSFVVVVPLPVPEYFRLLSLPLSTFMITFVCYHRALPCP